MNRRFFLERFGLLGIGMGVSLKMPLTNLNMAVPLRER